MSNIQLPNGRINIEGLDGIADHLKALAITNKTIDSIKVRVAEIDPSDIGRFRRTTDALTAWRKMQRRITERLSVLRQEEKQMNRMRSQFESEELLRLLRSEVSKESLLNCRVLAQAIAEQRLQEELNKAVGK
ncbi:hypothetical protein [Pantoea stewartii]|uniref:Uncharacterized protein n=1 Tax=Pantoea stewartii subsp. stewartii DC283 TaxID=660596 RepID=H3RBH5_PANSE|nr:hypothetical protein [Pantoea stewartii]ARF49619.1 hypothetical protein DSJ_09880 [Pantoea stewartii subsp. stewartii DC283]EHU01314.1 hypothetical protein CKS_4064 [Pantoea stewartii subsp. stewartii DC283]KAB0559982.1 hypothetical protein F7Q90_00900 [Pantoea stewartii subsp. stewartii]